MNLQAEYDSKERQIRAKRYGLDVDQLAFLESLNDGRCMICGQLGATCIDHDHRSGRVRGLLCGRCNTALGMFRDNPRLVQRAMVYLLEPPAYDHGYLRNDVTRVVA